MFDPSLLDLLAFVPSDRAVNEYIDDTKSSWLKGKYWLGGQIKLSPNDKITEQLLKQVQQIQDEPYDACNGAELASIWRAKRQFSQIQTAVHHFREDAKKRVLTELNNTKLNPDVNQIIVSFCG
jgi:hypothetical protein